MKSILEDLFLGKINVMESLPFKAQDPVPGEDSFISSLSPGQKQTLEEILGSLADRSAWESQKCFLFGFKMAVRMIFEPISDIEGWTHLRLIP